MTTPASTATTAFPYEAATSMARWPAWKYWLIEPLGTGHWSEAPVGAAKTALVGVPPTSAVPVGAGSGVASGSTGTGVGSGAGGTGSPSRFLALVPRCGRGVVATSGRGAVWSVVDS